MRRTLYPSAIGLLVAAIVHAQAREPKAELAAALAELNRGKVYEAIVTLKRIVPDDPDFGAANFYLSSLYTEMGRFDTARRYVERAIETDRKRGVYYHQLGVVHYREGRRRDALAAFEQALKLGVGGDAAAVWRDIGRVHADLLNWDEALRAYGDAARIQPKDAKTRLALGQFYLDREDPQRAAAELRAALEIDPRLSEAYTALGRAYRRLGEMPAAVAILRKGLELSSSDQESRYVLAQILLAMDRKSEGLREIAEYRRIQELMLRVDTLFENALDRLHAGELPEARTLLQGAVDLAPDYGPALHTLGAVLVERGEGARAVDMLKRALAANPLNSGAYFSLGAAYFQRGRLRDALEATQRAIVLFEEDARYHNQIGQIYRKLGRDEEARRAFEKSAALESKPGYRHPDPYESERRRKP